MEIKDSNRRFYSENLHSKTVAQAIVNSILKEELAQRTQKDGKHIKHECQEPALALAEPAERAPVDRFPQG